MVCIVIVFIAIYLKHRTEYLIVYAESGTEEYRYDIPQNVDEDIIVYKVGPEGIFVVQIIEE